MLEVTIALKNIEVKIKNPTSESIEDCVKLVEQGMSWTYGQNIYLDLYEEADETIYCEGEEPSEEREIDGL